MRRIITLCILPFIISLAFGYFFAIDKHVNELLFLKKSSIYHPKLEFSSIEYFYNEPSYEDQFLKCTDTNETIFLIGSSELTSSTKAIPFNFISKHFNSKLKAVGHAGNQCLSVYAQLLANEQRLENAPIVIIISPGWFESKPSKGTSSPIFLEFNSERFLNRIIMNENNSMLHSYLYKRVAQLYNEFNSPSLELKLMNFKYLTSKSFIHNIIYSPLIFCDELLLTIKEKITPSAKYNNELLKRPTIIPEPVSINWDSLFAFSREEVLKNSTNNNMGISDDYYNKYIHGRTGGHIEPVKEKFNQELEDFKMLMKLLKEKKVNASFIISPLNTLYFHNIKDILPIIKIIEYEINYNGFPYINLLETDPNKYDKAILNDIMHMSDYAWYKIDRFIIDTYHLNK